MQFMIKINFSEKNLNPIVSSIKKAILLEAVLTIPVRHAGLAWGYIWLKKTAKWHQIVAHQKGGVENITHARGSQHC